MRLTILLVTGIIIGVIFSVIGLTHWAEFAEDTRVTGYTYDGKALLMQTEYEYFKGVVARDDVIISELAAYNSNPVLVIFQISTPDDVPQFWGNQTVYATYNALQSEQNLYCGWFTFGGLIFALACSSVLLQRTGK